MKCKACRRVLGIAIASATLGPFAVSAGANPVEDAVNPPPTHVAGPGALESLEAWLKIPRDQRPGLDSQGFSLAPLTKEEARKAADLVWSDELERLSRERRAEWDAESIAIDGKVMKFEFRVFGEKPEGGRRLFISMHGGGNTPPEVNDQQWRNQIRLYQPEEGVYVAPRAPTNSWNLWHEPHIDAMFDRIIEDAVVFEGVSPDRVYLLGYSAGGDGVYQLAPRMADRWAAASMMAGHPNDASPLNLRNVPFAIHVGADDDGYGRNRVAREWGRKLDELEHDDAGPGPAYVHLVKLHEGRGHWMNREDAEAIGWMSGFTRESVPRRVVWRTGGPAPSHQRMYWLSLGAERPRDGTVLEAHLDAEEQAIVLDRAQAPGDASAGFDLVILLDDRVLDLDRPIKVLQSGMPLFEGRAARTVAALWRCVRDRADPGLMFAAEVRVRVR